MRWILLAASMAIAAQANAAACPGKPALNPKGLEEQGYTVKKLNLKEKQNVVGYVRKVSAAQPPDPRTPAFLTYETGRWHLEPSRLNPGYDNPVSDNMGEIFFTDQTGKCLLFQVGPVDATLAQRIVNGTYVLQAR